MTSLWPWLVVAGAGALHGLNPASGWALAAACGVRSGDNRQAVRALLPIAAGHAASIAVVAALIATTAAQGWSMSGALQGLAGALSALLLAAGLLRILRRGHAPVCSPANHAGLALWSFMATTAHGTGMMLVPALVPLCLGNSPAKALTASGSLPIALAAVGVHTAAMLVVTAVVSLGACGASSWLSLRARRIRQLMC